MNSVVAFYKSGAGVALAVSAYLTCAPAFAAGVSAGTVVENRAEVTYSTPTGPQTARSNSQAFVVHEVLDLAIASLDTSAVVAEHADAVLTFTLTNVGNGPESFELTANPSISGNDYDLSVNGFAIDSDDNGVYDEGVDLLLSAAGTTPEITRDSFATLFLLARVPSGTSPGARSAIELQAGALTASGVPGQIVAGAGEAGSDAIVGASGAQGFARGEVIFGAQSVELAKSARVSDPFGGSAAIPGATISYAIDVNVVGAGSVDNLTITDPIPEGTSYLPGTLLLNNTPLSDAAGDDAGEVSENRVLIALGKVTSGPTNTIQFYVQIQE